MNEWIVNLPAPVDPRDVALPASAPDWLGEFVDKGDSEPATFFVGRQDQSGNIERLCARGFGNSRKGRRRWPPPGCSKERWG